MTDNLLFFDFISNSRYLIIFILLCNMFYIRIPLLCRSCLLSSDRISFYFYYLIFSAHPIVHRPFPIFLLTLHRWRVYSLFPKTLQTECSCSASRIGTLCFTILFFLNSATLWFNFIYKFLSNKKLLRILPCQIFHLS